MDNKLGLDSGLSIIFHYPPQLLNLMIDTVPLLNRSKRDVVLFFKGAGVHSVYYNDLYNKVLMNRDSISKYEIVRTILLRLNEKGEQTLSQRREVLKRIIEFEDFTTCWPKDQWKAKGLVAEIKKIVNVKDSFTRMNDEREKERKKHQEEYIAKINKKNMIRDRRAKVKNDLFALFSEQNAFKRGKLLESVLNELFDSFDILVKEAFTLKGNEKEGIVEQIDGVIEFDSHIYLVEMKWWNSPIGPGEISPHLIRMFSRDEVRGIFISASNYTDAALKTCIEALRNKVVILLDLQEIVFNLEQDLDFRELLKNKVKKAIIEKQPY